MEESSNGSAGLGLPGWLFLIFLTLKLAGIGPVATWSWWWVTAPLWLPLVIGLVLFGLGSILVAVFSRR